jgi:hypothetical protein
MNQALPLPPSARVSVDRVRIIRQSKRCFIFGVMGTVPLFGLGAAWLSLRLWRQVASETGEPRPSSRLAKWFIVALVVALARFYFNGPASYFLLEDMALAIGIVLPLRRGYGLLKQYRQAEAREWNPARRLLYWGAWLGYSGLAISSSILLFLLGPLFHLT